MSDLVFVDAIGTGFSRILGQAAGGVGTPADFYGVDPDARSFAQFITRFLSEHGRWNSPCFLVDESNVTIRSAVLANILEQDVGIDLDGIILLSSNLGFATTIDEAGVNPGFNLSYAQALPTFAAAARYHRVLPQSGQPLDRFLEEVRAWAMGPYFEALDLCGMHFPCFQGMLTVW